MEKKGKERLCPISLAAPVAAILGATVTERASVLAGPGQLHVQLPVWTYRQRLLKVCNGQTVSTSTWAVRMTLARRVMKMSTRWPELQLLSPVRLVLHVHPLYLPATLIRLVLHLHPVSMSPLSLRVVWHIHLLSLLRTILLCQQLSLQLVSILALPLRLQFLRLTLYWNLV